MATKEMYHILKDKKVIACFYEGERSRFPGEKFSKKVAQKELESCQNAWKAKGSRSKFTLEIVKSRYS